MSSSDAPSIPDTTAITNVDLFTMTTKTDGNVVKIMVPSTGPRTSRFPQFACLCLREGVFTLVEVLKESELPPVKARSMSKNRVQYAWQHATIVGYNDENFRHGISNIQDVAYTLATVFAVDVTPWVPEDVSASYGVSLVGNCRYFTVGRKIPENSKVPFNADVDPAGTLKSYLSNSVAHCLDKSVAYLKLKDNSPVSKNPSAFRTGNIVEMGFTVVAFKMRHGKDRDNLTKSAHIARSTSAAATSNINKRKVSTHNAIPMQYRAKEDVSGDKDFEGAQERFRRLRLDTKVDELDEAMN
ncbi:hypothetical protein C8R44DRAFT_868628 [Mycena epipterygia]|nr:hypothetical protein C8R44DRAFT_868628 [Mycena epipterygia]